jgi:hypothetical protein
MGQAHSELNAATATARVETLPMFVREDSGRASGSALLVDYRCLLDRSDPLGTHLGGRFGNVPARPAHLGKKDTQSSDFHALAGAVPLIGSPKHEFPMEEYDMHRLVLRCEATLQGSPSKWSRLAVGCRLKFAQ